MPAGYREWEFKFHTISSLHNLLTDPLLYFQAPFSDGSIQPINVNPDQHFYPPSDLHQRKLLLKKCEPGLTLFRIHKVNFGPLFFGKSGDNRFDDPKKKYGVFYAGKDPYCAFIETFGHATGFNLIEEAKLKESGMAYVIAKDQLNLVNLTGQHLAHLGADNRLCDGDNYEICQNWSRSFYEHPFKPDGLWYRARHDSSRFAAAIFDCAEKKIECSIFVDTFANPIHTNILKTLLKRYKFGIV